MTKATKRCRICGKEYESCMSAINNRDGVFRWQEVACCPEHGAEYLRRVLEARGELADNDVADKDEGTQDEAPKPARKRGKKKEDSE